MEIKRPLSKQPIPPDAKKVFHGVIFDVYQWQQKLFDGSYQMFEKLKRPDTVLILAVTEDRKIISSYQEQPGKESFRGLVGGRVDEGETPLEAAKRELREESGYESDDWTLFDAIQPVSKIDWTVYTFVAKKCKKTGDQELEAGEKIKLELVTFEEFTDLIFTREFGDAEIKTKFLEAKLDPAKMAELKKLIIG